MYIARKFMLIVSHNGNPIIYYYIEIKYTENLMFRIKMLTSQNEQGS